MPTPAFQLTLLALGRQGYHVVMYFLHSCESLEEAFRSALIHSVSLFFTFVTAIRRDTIRAWACISNNDQWDFDDYVQLIPMYRPVAKRCTSAPRRASLPPLKMTHDVTYHVFIYFVLFLQPCLGSCGMWLRNRVWLPSAFASSFWYRSFDIPLLFILGLESLGRLPFCLACRLH